MHVLLACLDVFTQQGGGQTFFAEYIRSNPSIRFSFFSTRPGELSTLPANAKAVPLVDRYRRACEHIRLETGLTLDEGSLVGKQDDVYLLLDMAASVAGKRFDAIEIPDFLAFGALLPPALKAMDTSVDRVVLSMHGTLSEGLTENWAPEAMFDLPSLRAFERALYLSADLRYGIGRSYTEEWTETTGFEASLLDIATVFDFDTYGRQRRLARMDWHANPKPDLVFVGRQERWKGPDLFVDLASRLPAGAVGSIEMIGGAVDLIGHSSTATIAKMAELRRLPISFASLPRAVLLRKYVEAPWLVVLPSRRDTFNLSGLEAVLSGCPIAVTRSTGLYSYLSDAWPGLPLILMESENLTPALGEILGALRDYGALRRQLCDYLDSVPPLPVGSTREAIWHRPSSHDPITRAALDELCGEVLDAVEYSEPALAYESYSQRQFADGMKRCLPKPEDKAARELLTAVPPQVLQLESVIRDVAESTGGRLALSDARLATLNAQLAPLVFACDRARVFTLLAEIEKCRGNELLCATYMIRAIRLCGAAPAVVEEVADTLDRCGFPQEARVARWLYGPTKDWAAARAYLEAVEARQRKIPTGDIETTEDRRGPDVPRASIIVSLYRAADKLPVFLDGLARMTERTRRSCEILLIDSFSPDETEAVARRELDRLAEAGRPLNALYLRTSVRETIQRAWNRGIGLARAPYIAFLGCDEMNRPDAFDILIDHLDADPGLDWVQGTAIVTEVSGDGAFRRDIMAYDRTFETDVVQLLDTCFVGYVGALYRKSVHDHVGYYDESFRGAGDTEFKNRALPFMRVKTLPVCLGFFLNYPDERVTASPAVEIEDLRAWYLHRSPAGVAYLFDRRGPEPAAALARKCLSYRKSYLDQDSTDLELAVTLHDYLSISAPDAVDTIQQEAARSALSAYRSLDGVSAENKPTAGFELGHRSRRMVESAALRISWAARALRDDGWTGSFGFRNDNRSHQHFGIWPSTLNHGRVDSQPNALPIGGLTHESDPTPTITASPALTLQLLVTPPPGVQDLTCRIQGREIPGVLLEDGRFLFIRPGRRRSSASWTPSVELLDVTGTPRRDIDAVLEVDLKGVTDRYTGDRVLSPEHVHYIETDLQGEPAYRWTGPGEVASIYVPASVSAEGVIEITIFNTGPNSFDEVSVMIDGSETALLPDNPGWLDSSTIRLPLPPHSRCGYTIQVGVARTVTAGNDTRRIGVAWGRAKLILPLRLSY